MAAGLCTMDGLVYEVASDERSANCRWRRVGTRSNPRGKGVRACLCKGSQDERGSLVAAAWEGCFALPLCSWRLTEVSRFWALSHFCSANRLTPTIENRSRPEPSLWLSRPRSGHLDHRFSLNASLPEGKAQAVRQRHLHRGLQLFAYAFSRFYPRLHGSSKMPLSATLSRINRPESLMSTRLCRRALTSIHSQLPSSPA